MARSKNAQPCPLSWDEVSRIIKGNLVDEFERLRCIPGIRLDPVPWEQVVSLVAENTTESLGQLGRAPSGTVVYCRFKEKIEKEYASVADYMQKTVFDFPVEVTADGRRKVIVPALNADLRTVVWRLNDFPYHFEKGVEHHNIWCTVPLSEAEVLKVIEQERQGYEYVWFTNPVPLASIPTVWHAHVISKPLGDGLQSHPAMHAVARRQRLQHCNR